ncbi:glutathione S-transferase [Nitratireductor sp. ZSWI3]|uniref:glutathione S-transferase n=1 Tax=Nitratireductor sp. ZSWI3 TaxID=2966359 RepID=UPI00214F6846|nr:glutathione S-transferase [Nitratireductor sp. ZSWI3]MCR4268723.1 glutathione S-transferase [Nitratireductor sp. ZSWI3]
MRLFFSPASPYVRKVMVTAHEKGVADRIELLGSAASPVKRDQTIVAKNPSGKVPTMLLDDGSALFDSRVICAYVDAQAAEPRLMPSDAGRFRVLTLEALADSILDAALLARYETVMRPKELYWADWYRGQMDKIDSGLDALEAGWMDLLTGPVNAGSIAAACALGYLDFRFPDKDWRTARPGLAEWYASFSQRESMRRTMPQG